MSRDINIVIYVNIKKNEKLQILEKFKKNIIYKYISKYINY